MGKKKKTSAKSKCAKPLIPRVLVTPEVTAKIRQTAMASGRFETGGLLLGEKKIIDGQYSFIIRKTTGPGVNAEFSTHHFIPDVDFYKQELKSELYLNGLIYLGEWHKHPGSFDQPSCTDLKTMKDITEDDQTKDLVAIIATTPTETKEDNQNELVNIDCFYYQRGMKDFISVSPEFALQPELKRNFGSVEKINLDTQYIFTMAENGETEFMIHGSLTDNNVANFLKHNSRDNLKAKLLLKNNGTEEISINTGNEDLLVVVSLDSEKTTATAWQKDPNTNELLEVPVQLIDLQGTLYKRLGGLNIREKIDRKHVTLLGLGSVGSAAAVQLVKAGIGNLAIIDPDQLEVHNIIRHACDLNDLGRFKTDAVAEKLNRVNPDVNIQNIKKDFVEDYESVKKLIQGSDLLLISTDTVESRNLANMAAVDLKIPAVFISLYERARTGTVIRIVPGITGCRNCVGNGRWGSEMVPGTTDYTAAANERDIYFQPGLDTDISLVTNLGVKMAISTLLNPKSETAPEFNTNFIYWNSYPEGKYPMVTFADDLGIPKNKNCNICGSRENSVKKFLNHLLYDFELGYGFEK